MPPPDCPGPIAAPLLPAKPSTSAPELHPARQSEPPAPKIRLPHTADSTPRLPHPLPPGQIRQPPKMIRHTPPPDRPASPASPQASQSLPPPADAHLVRTDHSVPPVDPAARAAPSGRTQTAFPPAAAPPAISRPVTQDSATPSPYPGQMPVTGPATTHPLTAATTKHLPPHPAPEQTHPRLQTAAPQHPAATANPPNPSHHSKTTHPAADCADHESLHWIHPLSTACSFHENCPVRHPSMAAHAAFEQPLSSTSGETEVNAEPQPELPNPDCHSEPVRHQPAASRKAPPHTRPPAAPPAAKYDPTLHHPPPAQLHQTPHQATPIDSSSVPDSTRKSAPATPA